jgi:hypothetical protein
VRTPIVVAEGTDLSFYSSLEDVEWSLEAIDVDNGEYVAYDADGRDVPLSTKRLRPRKLLGMISVPGAEVVVASTPQKGPQHQEELRELLVKYLSFWEPASPLERMALKDLVLKGVERGGLKSKKPKAGRRRV